MRDLNRGETEDPAAVRETPFDLPDIPLDHQTTDQLSTELKIEQFINDSRKSLNLIKGLEKNVYKGMTVDKDGYLYYKRKFPATCSLTPLGGIIEAIIITIVITITVIIDIIIIIKIIQQHHMI